MNTHRYITRKIRNNERDFELYLVNFVTVKSQIITKKKRFEISEQ